MSIEPAIQNESLPESSRSTDRALLLHPIECPNFESLVVIERKESTLGSSEECDVPLPFPEIAAHHVTILDCEDEWTLKANDEKTWINGNAVQISDLKNGDRLKIGTIEFEVELKSLSTEDRPVDRRTTKKSTNKKRTKGDISKKKTDPPKAKTRSHSEVKKDRKSVNESRAEKLPAIDNISHNEVAECLTILKSLQDELEKDTAEMKKIRQDFEQEREYLQEERQKLVSDRQNLQDGFAAISQAREAIKTRENLLEERERNSSNRSASQSDHAVHSLYRKSEEEKLSDLRSELADKFHLELNDKQNAGEPANPTEGLPEFSEQELVELESSISLGNRADFKQQTEQVSDADASENEVVSVQEYMQNLLQRSRQDSPDDDARKSHSFERDLASRKRSANQIPIDPSNPESFIVDDSAIQARRQIDKQSVRADLQSMRELANISARSAIAQHFTKRLKFSIYLKLVLTVLSFSLAVAIFFLTNEGFHVAAVLQAGAISIVAITLAELLRSFSQAHKAILNDFDRQCDDNSETQNIDFEINDSAILNHPDLISEDYQSDLSVSESEFATPGEESDRQDELETSGQEELQVVGETNSSDENEEISSKDTIMEIPVEPEFEGE